MTLNKCKKTNKVKLSFYVALIVSARGKLRVYKCKYCGWRHATGKEVWKHD